MKTTTPIQEMRTRSEFATVIADCLDLLGKIRGRNASVQLLSSDELRAFGRAHGELGALQDMLARYQDRNDR